MQQCSETNHLMSEITNMNKKDDYRMLQISADNHKLLKEYCKARGLKMGHLVGQLIRQYVNKKR
jgi:hypothetical protein